MLLKTLNGIDALEGRLALGGLKSVSHHEETIRRAVILALIYLLPAVAILEPVIVDPDIWWHLQSGKWIVDHGTLPTTDPFSIYGENKPWIVYSWLFEVGVYGLVQAFGKVGIILYTLVGVWAVMLVLHRMIAARISDFVAACGLLALGTIAMSRMFTPRPWLMTIFFFAVTLELVLSLREGKTSRWHWSLPLLYILWANTHIQFIYGLGLLGLACIAPILDQLAQPYTRFRTVMGVGSAIWKRLVVITALCGFATLLTPYNLRLYSAVVVYAGQTGFWEVIQEMQAPEFRTLADWAMLVIFSLAMFRLGYRKTCSLFELLLIGVAGISAFHGQRDVWFLVCASLVIVFPSNSEENKRKAITFPREAFALFCALVLIWSVGIIQWRDLSEAKIQENTSKIYPLAAAAFVEKQRYPGPLYNHFDWGGYLLWQLQSLKVSMDGRGNVHGDDRVKKSIATWNGGPQWGDNLELIQANVVIAQKAMPLTSILRLDPRFQVAYQDEIAVVFTRRPQ